MTMRKYRNKPQEIDGIRFDSIKEAKRYGELKLLEKAKEIDLLVTHPRWPIVINGQKVCIYEADFQYLDMERARLVVEDAKGVRTPVYQLKKKLMLAVHGIVIKEV